MKVESALKPLLDPKSIILFEACSTENSNGKGGRLIPPIDLKILFGAWFTSAFLLRKIILFFSLCKVKVWRKRGSGSPESLCEFGSFVPVRALVKAPPSPSRWDVVGNPRFTGSKWLPLLTFGGSEVKILAILRVKNRAENQQLTKTLVRMRRQRSWQWIRNMNVKENINRPTRA